MPLNRAEKEAIVQRIATVAGTAISAAAAEYRGLTVAQITDLRNKAREAGVFLKVVPNNLAKLGVTNTKFECLKTELTGPLILAFSEEAPGAAAKIFRDYAKKNDKLVVKALALGGNLIDVKNIAMVADLPTRDEALSTLLAVMKAPISKFVRTLAEPTAKFVRTIAAVRDQKQEAGA